MSKIQRILVAIDFSPAAERALALAESFAGTLGASLDVVHVLEVPAPSASPYGVLAGDAFFVEMRRRARGQLDALVAKLGERGIEAGAHLAEPPIASAIEEVARAIDADLIVMGTRGNAGLKHILLGSVAERTLRHAPCPVLTVK